MPPEGFKTYQVIVTPDGKVVQPASCWIVEVDVFTERELRHDLDRASHMGDLLERRYNARGLTSDLKGVQR